jgi:hypothetical protein
MALFAWQKLVHHYVHELSMFSAGGRRKTGRRGKVIFLYGRAEIIHICCQKTCSQLVLKQLREGGFWLYICVPS